MYSRSILTKNFILLEKINKKLVAKFIGYYFKSFCGLAYIVYCIAIIVFHP
jgi:hypothetical protein